MHPEPWLRGTLADVPAIPRAVLHALELAHEDLHHWCRGLSAEQINARPAGIAPVAFHLRHIARSMDRLLTYAEGSALTAAQIAVLKTELEAEASSAMPRDEIFVELDVAFAHACNRVRALDALSRAVPGFWDQARTVGSKHLPTTVGGLLIHVAEHTLRHVGQAITTAKVVRG